MTNAVIWPNGVAATVATLTTSLFDFDSSLPKYLKAVMIDADIPDDASIDIAYFTNTIPATTTTALQTGAAAGTEYVIGTVARSIGFTLTLNATSTPPKLKRIYVRAAPMQQTFRRAEYCLNLTGRDGDQPIALRDTTPHAKDGMTMAQNLFTAATAAAPISITDRFGTFTGILEPDQLELREIRPEEFVARVVVRQT